MEVFDCTGESGMAIIHMDNKPVIRLKFQYRINIAIFNGSHYLNCDSVPQGLNTQKRSVDTSDVSRDNFGETVEAFNEANNGLANEYTDLKTTLGNSASSSIRKENAIIISSAIQESSRLFENNFTPEVSYVSPDNEDNGIGNADMDVLWENNGVVKGANNVNEYKEVRENLETIFENKKSKDSEDFGVKSEDEDINSTSDKGCDGDESLSNIDSDQQGMSGLNSEKQMVEFSNPKRGSSPKGADDSVFSCDVCHKVFESKSLYIEHREASTVKVKCLVCKEECPSRACLMLHDYIAHTSQGNLSKKLYKECPLCTEPFFNDSDLVIHIKSKHTNEGVYKCCLCHKVFQSESALEEHTNICKTDKNYVKLARLNKKLSTNLRAQKQTKSDLKSELKVRGKRQSSKSKSIHLKIKKSNIIANPIPIEQLVNESKCSPMKRKIPFKKEDKASAKLKKAKLNAQYYQKVKQQRLLKKEKEAEERAAKGDNLNPAIVIERNHSIDEKESSWDKTWKCKFCDRIFMYKREFMSHNMPMRTKRVCTKCGDRSKSKAEYLLHQCKKDTVDQEDEKKVSRGKRKCPVCNEEFPKKEILKHVMFQHTNEMPYLCCICGTPLESYESWISHCESFHSKSDEVKSNKYNPLTNISFSFVNSQNNLEIVCRLCKSHFNSKKDYIHHHKHETVKKVCNICETSTFTEAGYIVHRYLSHGLSPDEHHSISTCYGTLSKNLWEEDRFDEYTDDCPINVKCPCCPEIVNTSDLFFHVLEVHTHESPFKCCSCDNVSPTMAHYIQHCDFHLGKRIYNNKTPRCLQCDLRFESRRALNSHKQFHQRRCPYCQTEFSSAVFLKIHLQNYHTKDMEACSFCGKLFACSTQLAEHERHHYFSKQSQCTVCGKLIFARNMAKHMKIAHPKSDDDFIYCTVCNKRFRDRHQMEQHQLCHSTDFTHECDVCKKKFKNAIRLREHAKVHLDKKRLFVCDICGKTCTEKYNLQVHMRVHSSTKEFHCPLCNQGFNYNQSLKSHMEKEHNKVSVGPQHFNCSFCNTPFGYIHTLEAHMREKHGYSATNYGPASQWYPLP